MKLSKVVFSVSLCMLFFLACTPKIDIYTEEISKEVQSIDVGSSADFLSKELVQDDSWTMGSLENGMQYYIKKNAKPENRAELRLVVKAGSVDEDEDQRGLAHFVEHMAFNGTENFAKNELVEYLESVGSQFGPDLNAYTSFDETVYMLQVRTDSSDHLNKGMLILQDWAGGLSFDPDEIDKERGVVLSEWRTGLSAEQRMQQEYFPLIFHGSKYAERLPIGKTDIIENAPYDALIDYYKDWYRPDLMALVVVGDVDIDHIELEIKKRFSQLENPENPRPKETHSIGEHEETFVKVLTDKEAQFSRVNLIYKHKQKDMKTVSDYREVMVQQLYNQMLNARLSELSKSAVPPFLFAYSGYSNSVADLANYSSMAVVQDGEVMQGFKTMLTENRRVREFGFLESELERAKTTFISNLEKAAKEESKMESGRLVQPAISNFLKSRPMNTKAYLLEISEALMDGIKTEEINEVSASWFRDDNRIVIVTGPEKFADKFPKEESLLKLLEFENALTVEPYVDSVSDEPLFDKSLKASRIQNEVVYDDVDIIEWELANGVKVFLKATDFKNDEILMRSYSYGGHSNYSDEDFYSASNASNLVNESGLAGFNSIELQKKLTGKKLRLTPYISETSEGINGNSSPDDLETFFQLLYLYFTDVTISEDAMSNFVETQKGIFSNLYSNPETYFANQTRKIRYKSHPRRMIPKAEDFDKIDRAKALEIYQERFADASDFNFFFVGSFDLPTMEKYVTTYLANLPTVAREDKWQDVKADQIPGFIQKTITKGEAPKSTIEMVWHGDFDDSRENRYLFYSMIEYLRIKLRESLREDQGGVYGVRLRGNVQQIPKDKYSITLSYNCDPDQVENLNKAVNAEIMNLKQGSILAEDLEKVTESQVQSRIKNFERNSYWISSMVSSHRNEIDFNLNTLENYKSLQSLINGADLSLAAKNYFDLNRHFSFVLNPE